MARSCLQHVPKFSYLQCCAEILHAHVAMGTGSDDSSGSAEDIRESSLRLKSDRHAEADYLWQSVTLSVRIYMLASASCNRPASPSPKEGRLYCTITRPWSTFNPPRSKEMWLSSRLGVGIALITKGTAPLKRPLFHSKWTAALLWLHYATFMYSYTARGLVSLHTTPISLFARQITSLWRARCTKTPSCRTKNSHDAASRSYHTGFHPIDPCPCCS